MLCGSAATRRRDCRFGTQSLCTRWRATARRRGVGDCRNSARPAAPSTDAPPASGARSHGLRSTRQPGSRDKREVYEPCKCIGCAAGTKLRSGSWNAMAADVMTRYAQSPGARSQRRRRRAPGPRWTPSTAAISSAVGAPKLVHSGASPSAPRTYPPCGSGVLLVRGMVKAASRGRSVRC